MRIAIVGGGISGLVAAYQLQRVAEVSLFEANDYIGGHTHTVDVKDGDRTHAVDTGFIVYNDWTYPNFIRLLEKLKVATQASDMSFALSDPRTGFAYAAPQARGLFAHKANALSPSFYRMLWDIVRFSKHGPEFLKTCEEDAPLSEFFAHGRYSRTFLDRYLVPMISAIWSAGCDSVADLPARYFLHFFENHGLMNIKVRPQWRVIAGGSRNYIPPLIKGFKDRVHTHSPVSRITRHAAIIHGFSLLGFLCPLLLQLLNDALGGHNVRVLFGVIEAQGIKILFQGIDTCIEFRIHTLNILVGRHHN